MICRILLTLSCFLLLAMGACSGTETIEKEISESSDPDVQINVVMGCQSDAECDDSNSCTRDTCGEDGECAYEVLVDQPCDDGNACTQDDLCGASGSCGGNESLGCNDGKLCTEDSCDPKSGCIYAPLTIDMECDGSLCTAGDSCVEGVCAAGQLTDCADENPTDCIFFVCENQSGKCTVQQYQPEGFPCHDANPCTDADACDATGTCISGTDHECISQNPCKTAWCNEQAKEGTNPCVTDFVGVGTPCNDDSKCTDADSCTPVGDDGPLQCQGVPVNCNDANPCTLDTCDEGIGCAFESKSNGTPCDLPGGGVGSCQEGICQDGEPTDCNDNIACTIDSDLGNGECQHTPNHLLCDDNEACNGLELCDVVEGCLPGDGLVCDDGTACTDDSCDANGCVYTPNVAKCDDGNPCTADSCGANGCEHAPQAGDCNDNNPCTAGESCSNGQCTGGAPTVCDDGIECTADSCQAGVGCVFDNSNCAGECTPYVVESCYAGPAGTSGIGRCQPGHRQCRADGSDWSPCYGAQIPLGEDLCSNGVDDDCDGTQTDENCSATVSGAVWADFDNGSDTTGNGSFANPFKTIVKALSQGSKTIAVKADANGTIYTEDKISIGGSKNNMVMIGVGPTRPILAGSIDIVHCYDCTFEDLELRYPDPAHFAPDKYPSGAIDAVHNYRNVWRNIRLSAPLGLPAGKRLATCHHGYDNLFIDIEVGDLKLMPAADGSATFALLNWGDHGSGSQFIRVTWDGPLSLTGPEPQNGSVQFLRIGGYTGTWPKGVSAVRNLLVGDFDLQSVMPQGSFTGIDFWFYYDAEFKGGVMVANNTLADVKATNVNYVAVNYPFNTELRFVGNIFGPASEPSTGVSSNAAVQVTYSDFFALANSVSGSASLGAGTIQSDPQFNADYTLSGNSPCHDSGNPNWTDPDGTVSDMGAFGGPMAN